MSSLTSRLTLNQLIKLKQSAKLRSDGDPAVLLFGHRVETCTNENSELRRKVENLEGTNR